MEDLEQHLRAQAAELGFVRFGVARAESLEREGEHLRRWLDAGHHGAMGYMASTAQVRCDPRHAGMLPSAVSIIVLVTPYGSRDGIELGLGKMARYARNRDYHNVLQKRLRKLCRSLREAGHVARAAVDSLPVYERAWAERAGVGFIGKNCCLIVPGLGSNVFLSVLVTSAPLPVSTPMKSRCGECRACLDACPTSAFVGARQLDARRCISYLTIEERGPIPPPLRAGTGSWVFGCDVCQDVCPFNSSPRAETTDDAFAHPRFKGPVEQFLVYSESDFMQATLGSPVRRPGRAGMARNAAIVLGNRGDRRHLPLLQRSAESDSSEVVREAATWAMAQITSRSRST